MSSLQEKHRRIQDFFSGGLKDEFIRMCTDISEDPTAHTQLITIHILAKLHSHHYPGLLGRFRSRSGLQNNSAIVLKLI